MMYVRAYDTQRPAGSRYDGEAELPDDVDVEQSIAAYWRQRKCWPIIVVSHKPSGAKRRTFAMRRKEA
jgi:hypothetical protein